jgi:hypothetical protein
MTDTTTRKVSTSELIETLAFTGMMAMFYHAGADGLTFSEIVDRTIPGLAPDEIDRLAIVLEDFFARKEEDFIYAEKPSQI